MLCYSNDCGDFQIHVVILLFVDGVLLFITF